jgi:diadenosine tetraphosphate (Ap4A) HIT family hydrolase
MIIYKDNEIYIEAEDSQLPWLKIFTQEPFKELGDMPKELRLKLWEVYDIVEFYMNFHYKPTKINMASFGNVLPRVHIHIIARFENDNYFPNPVWGKKLRDTKLNLPSAKQFHKELHTALSNQFISLQSDRRKSSSERRRGRD